MDDLKTNIPNKKIIISIFLISALSIFIFIFLVFTLVADTDFLPDNKQSPSPSPANSAINQGGELEKDYSKINQIIPGKTTFAEAQQINGKAESTQRTENKTYLYYKTPIDFNQNIVAVENNRVVYSTEFVYGDYRKSVAEFKADFGNPELTLFDQSDSYAWSIFLTKGIGIKSDGKDVGKILYFAPQSQIEFMNKIATELKLSTEAPGEVN